MAVLRLFAQAREAAGSARDTVDGATVDEVLAGARARHGDGVAALLTLVVLAVLFPMWSVVVTSLASRATLFSFSLFSSSFRRLCRSFRARFTAR